MNTQTTTQKAQPRGINLKQAAAHVGVKPQTYKRLENEGVLPGPIYRNTYDRLAIDTVFDALSGIRREALSSDRDAQLDHWLRSGGGRGN